MGLGHQPLTRLCAPGSGPRLWPQCAPLLPAQTSQELRLPGGRGWGPGGPPGTRLLRGPFQEGQDEAPRPGRPAGSEVPQAWPPWLLPAGLGRWHTRCGGGFGAPRAARAAWAAGGGEGAGTRRPELANPSAGWGGAAPASRADRASAAGLPTRLGSYTFFAPSFLTQPQLSAGRTLVFFLPSSLP